MKTRKIVVSIVAVIALIAIMSVCLVACNYESYEAKLEKKGYTVIGYEADDSDGATEWALNATKANGLFDIDNVTVIKYVDVEDAKEAEATLGEDAVYRIGTIVIFGTEQGVKDAK